MTDYGSDLACQRDFTDECRTVTGLQLLAEALLRRLTTPRGNLLDDPDYGTDLHEYIALEFTSRNQSRMLADVKAECIKDERVVDAFPSVRSFSLATKSLVMEIAVEASEETFLLVLKIPDVTVEVLSVG